MVEVNRIYSKTIHAYEKESTLFDVDYWTSPDNLVLATDTTS